MKIMSWLLKYVIKLIRVILTKYKIWILKLEKLCALLANPKLKITNQSVICTGSNKVLESDGTRPFMSHIFMLANHSKKCVRQFSWYYASRRSTLC